MLTTEKTDVKPFSTALPCREIGVPDYGETCYKDINIHLRIGNSPQWIYFDQSDEPEPGFLILDHEIILTSNLRGNTKGPTATTYQSGAATETYQKIAQASKDFLELVANTKAKFAFKGQEFLDALADIERRFKQESSYDAEFAQKWSTHNYGVRITAATQAQRNWLGIYKSSGSIDAIARIYRVFVGNPETVQGLAKRYQQEVERLTAASLPLEAVADTYVRADVDARKNDNYGRDRCMEVGTNRSSSFGLFGAADAMRALVQFDTLSIAGPIQKATLELAIHNLKAPTAFPFTIGVYQIMQPWQEGNGAEGYAELVPGATSTDDAEGVAWEAIDANNQPQPATNPSAIATAQVLNTAKPGDIVTWDVTPLVREWLSNPACNYGLMLRDLTSDGDFRYVGFGTRECDLYAYPDRVRGPRLMIQM